MSTEILDLNSVEILLQAEIPQLQPIQVSEHLV